MFIEQATRKQLRNVVAERMRKAILDGYYKPGEWLRQERIAQELGVSQMPVREALKELEAEGLIEHVPYRGARVSKFSAEDVWDLYTHRAFLEGRAANFAAKNITPEEIANLKQLQKDMEANLAPESVMAYRSINRNFHEAVVFASRHEYLIRALSQLWVVFPSMMIINFSATAAQPIPERDQRDIEEHHRIIDTLEKRKSELAEEYVREHILSAGQQLIHSFNVS
jgi:DNA-binding GntR family transcriptional regulator